MRIVGGRLKGRVLKGPSSSAIRPTSDRLRETLFNILAHAYDDPVQDARVIDLFAGTGALAFEALSRGAAFAQLVDTGDEARAAIRENVVALGLAGITKLFRRDARKLGPIGSAQPFTLAFLDPPYGQGLAGPCLAGLLEGGWLAPGALVIVEEKADADIAAPSALKLIETRDYDDTKVSFFSLG